MSIFPVFYKTSETCSGNLHVWFTDAIPPMGNLKCECGTKTWSQYCEEAQQTVQSDNVGWLPKIDTELLECGHSVSYIVYSERRNYCGICDRDAHRKNPAFNSPRRR